MTYEVWDSETANIVGAFESEDEAWAAIANALETNGPGYVAELVFGVEDDDGESTLIASGTELIDRARAHAAAARKRVEQAAV